MTLQFIKDRDRSGRTVSDMTAASGSLKTASTAAPDFTMRAFNTTNGDYYIANNGVTWNARRTLTCYYDFATDGGAVGAITLRGGSLPVGAVITNGVLYNTTAWTSGGSATISLGLLTDDVAGIKAATAVATIGAAGPIVLIQTGAAANVSEITTAVRNITMTIAVADLTAGAFVLNLEYFVAKADTSTAV